MFLLLWIVALIVLAGLIFAGLTVFTNWNLGARIGCSLLSAFITFNVLGFISATLDLIPDFRTSIEQRLLQPAEVFHVARISSSSNIALLNWYRDCRRGLSV